MMSSDFIQLTSPKHLDIISDTKFSQDAQDNLLVSTWCNKLLLYNCKPFENYPHEEPTIDPVCTLDTAETPLCLLYPKFSSPIIGSLDGSVQELEFENMKLGPSFAQIVENDSHENGINNICLGGTTRSIIASSFNRNLQHLDSRQRKPIGVYPNKRKIHTMDSTDQYLILGLSDNVIEIYDLKNLHEPLETRDVGLRYQFKDIKTFPNQEGFAVATIDARVSIEYFNPSLDVQNSKRFIFKSHRHYDEMTGTDIVFPINSIAFDKKKDYMLLTGSSDGHVCLWDIEKRKRMKQFPRFEPRDQQGVVESVAKMDVSSNGKLLAVATSDDTFMRRRSLSEDMNSRHPSKIYVKQLG